MSAERMQPQCQERMQPGLQGCRLEHQSAAEQQATRQLWAVGVLQES